jgi:PleD family two-component response regulator
MTFPKRILLIDREPPVTRLVRQALEKTGKYLIKEEHSGQFTLHSARWFQPDLILLYTVAASSDRDLLARQLQADTALRSFAYYKPFSFKWRLVE